MEGLTRKLLGGKTDDRFRSFVGWRKSSGFSQLFKAVVIWSGGTEGGIVAGTTRPNLQGSCSASLVLGVGSCLSHGLGSPSQRTGHDNSPRHGGLENQYVDTEYVCN